MYLRWLLCGLTLALAGSCDRNETAVEREARQWLARHDWIDADQLDIRNVRRVGNVVCGEARQTGLAPDFQNFFFYEEVEGQPGRPIWRPLVGEPVQLPDGKQCPATDEFLELCAATEDEREAASLRRVACEMSGGGF